MRRNEIMSLNNDKRVLREEYYNKFDYAYYMWCI